MGDVCGKHQLQISIVLSTTFPKQLNFKCLRSRSAIIGLRVPDVLRQITYNGKMCLIRGQR